VPGEVNQFVIDVAQNNTLHRFFVVLATKILCDYNMFRPRTFGTGAGISLAIGAITKAH